jgi:hypothetical protein
MYGTGHDSRDENKNLPDSNDLLLLAFEQQLRQHQRNPHFPPFQALGRPAQAQATPSEISRDHASFFLGGSTIPPTEAAATRGPPWRPYSTGHAMLPTAGGGAASCPMPMSDFLRRATRSLPLQPHHQERQQGFTGISQTDSPLTATCLVDSHRLQLGSFAQMQEALRVVPLYEKEDYLKALEVSPQLVMTESDPLRFLRHQNFNAQTAAQGLARYWKRRREIFGERTFLPMTITGDGALSAEDIEFINSGVVAFLPSDVNGRTVICYDSSRRLEQHSVESHLRAAFYYGQIVAENAVSQTDGYIALVAVCELYCDALLQRCLFFFLSR